MELNLSLKQKQNPPEETWREWIAAHAENEIRKGNYVGRAWYLSNFESYFSGKTIDEKDREILEIAESLGLKLSSNPCENFKFEDGESIKKCYCQRYTKIRLTEKDGKKQSYEEKAYLGSPARKTSKCKNRHDYFSAVNACYKIE